MGSRLCRGAQGPNPQPTSIRGGAKILSFRHIHSTIITLSAPKGGQTPLPTSMGGHGRISPPGSATDSGRVLAVCQPCHRDPRIINGTSDVTEIDENACFKCPYLLARANWPLTECQTLC